MDGTLERSILRHNHDAEIQNVDGIKVHALSTRNESNTRK